MGGGKGESYLGIMYGDDGAKHATERTGLFGDTNRNLLKNGT